MTFVLKTGDMAQYNPQFQQALVTVIPGVLTGSGRFNVNNVPACVLGDEATAMSVGCVYISGPYVVPGVGTLSVMQLNADQISTSTLSSSKPVLLKGSTFIAQFQVMVPAQTPPPASTPDPLPIYVGSGTFITTNVTVQG